MKVRAALALLPLLAPTPRSPSDGEQASRHAAEIKAFASTMAIARTARETCPGAEADEGYLEALRLRLHVVEADHAAFAPEAHAAAEALKQGRSAEPASLVRRGLSAVRPRRGDDAGNAAAATMRWLRRKKRPPARGRRAVAFAADRRSQQKL